MSSRSLKYFNKGLFNNYLKPVGVMVIFVTNRYENLGDRWEGHSSFETDQIIFFEICNILLLPLGWPLKLNVVCMYVSRFAWPAFQRPPKINCWLVYTLNWLSNFWMSILVSNSVKLQCKKRMSCFKFRSNVYACSINVYGCSLFLSLLKMTQSKRLKLFQKLIEAFTDACKRRTRKMYS